VNGARAWARSVSGKSSGKLYAEFISIAGGGVSTSVGLYNGEPGTPETVPGFTRAGGGEVSGGAFWDSYTTGATLCMAVDMDNKRIWTRVNSGNWNNSATANPATNAEGVDISAYTTAFFAAAPAMAAGRTVTVRTDSATWTQTAPVGFGPWTA